MSLARKLGRPATLADLEAVPAPFKGEILDGELYVQPRPRFAHANVETAIASALRDPFQQGRGGPGGWWILVEPGIEAGGSPEFSPDLAGWRRERLPVPPRDEPIRVVPDWVCEVMSPATRGYDQLRKRPFYARIGVAWLWYVDPDARTVIVSKLVGGAWMEVAVVGEDDKVRLEPFTEIELHLAEWWLPESG